MCLTCIVCSNRIAPNHCHAGDSSASAAAVGPAGVSQDAAASGSGPFELSFDLMSLSTANLTSKDFSSLSAVSHSVQLVALTHAPKIIVKPQRNTNLQTVAKPLLEASSTSGIKHLHLCSTSLLSELAALQPTTGWMRLGKLTLEVSVLCDLDPLMLQPLPLQVVKGPVGKLSGFGAASLVERCMQHHTCHQPAICLA